jgi:CRISPR-associated protein Cst2
MAFVSGLLLIDAPASALNNSGKLDGSRYENAIGAKVIRVLRDGDYPYVSAQAFRYWLRNSISAYVPKWRSSPIYREKSVAYTYADPIDFWDDDLLGYMRAPGGDGLDERKKDPNYKKLPQLDVKKDGKKEKEQAVTRVSPFRVSTFVAISPVLLNEDFESMTRHEGDPVPYMNQFYRATLQGLFSLDLRASGTFSYADRTGFKNLSTFLQSKAKEVGLEHLEATKCYRLPQAQRSERVRALFEGLAHLEGGAKQTLHYTDVSPAVAVLAVTKGGNHIFGHIMGATKDGKPVLKTDALNEALRVFADDLLSPVFIGWTTGYADDERAKAQQMASEDARIKLSHPREAFLAMADALDNNPGWLE